MIVIDSSFWLELFEGSRYGKIINDNKDFLNYNFLVPSITVIEVYKKLLIEKDSNTALLYTTQMKVGKVIDLDFELAIIAAQNGKKYKLPLADSIIYTTSLENNATLYTLDKHFKDLPNVEYYQK
ncbi:MAG: type II toxin-antitoxin system VapC family toxin [Candidatus Kapabacteria bacterium]|nr:type II toxin-antitoxin system VapC family toxin [Candidatus Kapabacteria bacterium]